ncbi:MAG: NACHT domain-containing protein [Ruminiclostridium sp.]|nr:NACHT domain-containing protein [Ruminiclostridium sp.]
MAKFTNIETEILKQVTIDRLRTSLEKIREAAEDIWADDAPRIIQDYTDHGIKHSERLVDFIYNLLHANDGRDLSAQEMYLLLAGIYLHDIGMQCDLITFPNIKERAEALGAKFEVDFTAKTASKYSIDEQKAIRKNHQYLTAAWIDHASRTGKTVLGQAAKTIPEDLVDDLMDVCKHHAKLPISDCPLTFKFDPTGRKLLVASLLRFSDELDVEGHRVSIETVKNFSLDPRNSIYWWLHNRTKVVFSARNVIIITIRLHPEDVKNYGLFIHDTFITEFQTKNRPVLSVLARDGIPILIGDDSKVIEHDRAERLPIEIVRVLETMQQEHNPLIELADEVRIWLRAIRYEVSDLQTRDDRTVDMIATMEQGTVKQRVLIRCIGGEITSEDVDFLDKALDRKTPQGWLISDKRVSDGARKRAAGDDAFRVFNLSNFLQQMVWGPYFDSLKALVEKSRIPDLYVDLKCYKQMMDASGNDINREKYSSLDDYIDNWLTERAKMHISLLGEFGSGKTWFCRHFAYRQLERYLKDPVNERLPVLITLRSFSKNMTEQQLINDALLEQYKLPFVGSAFEVFQEMSRRGKLLLILDGFDEMARQVDYQTVVDNFWLLANLAKEGSKVILTSRTEYFRWAKESEKILGGEEFGRRTILLSPPKFEVLYLEPFNDDQISQVITLRLGAKDGPLVAKRILEKSNLAEMARKPVLVELLLAALDEVSADVLENPARVYLYATNKLLLRNMDTKRTFTTTSDKLYFLCELAWEMIKSGELRIHFTSIPERIKEYFGERIKDQHELDTWDFDLRNQTLLHRNAAGYYEFAHKSLAEYFVAFKFAAELNCLSQAFSQTYCEADGKCCPIPIKQKNVVELAETFGRMALTDNRMHAVIVLLLEIIAENASLRLWELIKETSGKTLEQVKYAGGNAATILRRKNESFEGVNLANTILASADLHNSNFTDADFQRAYMEEINMNGCNLTRANMKGCDLHKCNFINAILLNVNMMDATLTDILIDDPKVKDLTWSLDGKYLAAITEVDIRIWNTSTWELTNVLQTRIGQVDYLVWNTNTDLIVTTSFQNSPISVWDIHRPGKLKVLINDEIMSNNLYFSPSGKYLSASHGGSGKISIWDISTGKKLTSFEAQKGWCNAALFLPDEETLLSTGYGGDIRIWNWRLQNLIFKFVIMGAGNAYQLQLNKSYDRVAAVTSFPENPDDFGTEISKKFLVWTFPDFRPVFSEEISFARQVFSLSPDGSRIAFIERKQLNLYNLILKKIEDNSKDVFLVEDYKQPLTSIKFSVDGNILAYSSKSSIYLCDIDSGSTNFGECNEVLKIKMDCQGMIIRGARGIQQKRKLETEGEEKDTLLEFFEERGAVLDEEQKQFLTEARKEMPSNKV